MPVVSNGQVAADVVLHANWRGEQVQDKNSKGKKPPKYLAGFSNFLNELQYHFHFQISALSAAIAHVDAILSYLHYLPCSNSGMRR